MNGDLIEYFRLSGARTILAALGSRLPTSPEERARLLQPNLRAAWTLGEQNGRSLEEVADQIYTAAEIFSLNSEVQPRAIENFPTAKTSHETATILHDIANYVTEWRIGLKSNLGDITPTGRELGFRFPGLSHFLGIYFGQDGEAFEDDITEAQAVQMYIDVVHPACPWRITGLVGECHEAMALFHDEQTLYDFFQRRWIVSSGSLTWMEFLPLIADTIKTHMREHHRFTPQ
ncbi:contact-dependent growth inhibition system immunity protein [Streptomyces sp. HSW2009]|uniref:contact-dependent growth inhibition system immunity protein n=1 Tax=Streptomyces sp. HSW2009 TaxID=3142890 RepID=UPI0032EB30D6